MQEKLLLITRFTIWAEYRRREMLRVTDKQQKSEKKKQVFWNKERVYFLK